MIDIEHPSITRANKTGYPNIQSEHRVIDVMGDEIIAGNDYVELPDGELLLERNIKDYHIDVLGWKYKKED